MRSHEEFYSKLKEINDLIETVNKGNAAFWKLANEYPTIVRTKLGKDESLKEGDLRAALGNDLELAIGEKKL